MRGYEELIQEAELMALPPLAVAEFLKRRDAHVYEEVEKSLRARGDSLIDLALARYGRCMAAVSGLFHAATPGSPVRLACLTNTALGNVMPEYLLDPNIAAFSPDPKRMVEWLLSASDDELTALFENPTLSDSFLRDLLERSDGWESITDEMLCRFVSILQRNARMRTPREDVWMDGYAEYSYGSVFNAAWKLSATAPTTESWARTLGNLYVQLKPDAFSIEEPLALATRWHVDPADAPAVKREADSVASGFLSDMQLVRQGLARLALSNNASLLVGLLASDDVALRAAAYTAGSLNEEQLRAGYAKDGELAYNVAIFQNQALWKHADTRRALFDLAWSVVNNDKYSELSAANLYKSKEKDMREKQPGWFSDEEGDKEPDDGGDEAPATKADIYTISGHLTRQSQDLNAISENLRTLISRTSWIWWFSLGALAASIWNF